MFKKECFFLKLIIKEIFVNKSYLSILSIYYIIKINIILDYKKSELAYILK